jgi:hypothetical protein
VVDTQHRFSKCVREQITLIEGHGVGGDAHAGQYARRRFLARRWPKLGNLRQVHLIPVELFAELHQQGHIVEPGDLGENVTTAGLNLEYLPLGTKLHLGESAVVELTGLRTPCGRDALGTDQSLGTPKRNKAYSWRGGLLHRPNLPDCWS